MQSRNRIVAQQPPIDFGQIANRAAGADQAFIRLEWAHTRLLERLVDMLFEAAHFASARRIGLQKLIAEAERAELQAPRALEPPIAKMDQLKASSAHVEDDAVFDRQPVDRAQEAELGF